MSCGTPSVGVDRQVALPGDLAAHLPAVEGRPDDQPQHPGPLGPAPGADGRVDRGPQPAGGEGHLPRDLQAAVQGAHRFPHGLAQRVGARRGCARTAATPGLNAPWDGPSADRAAA
jgi:hypothetical protein